MDKHIEVIQQIFPLLDTLEEGILHIENQLKELRYEEGLMMLQDVMEGIASIESAMQPMDGELAENNISILLLDVKKRINGVVTSYEQGKEINLENQITQELFPAFLNWKEEIEKALKPYIVS